MADSTLPLNAGAGGKTLDTENVTVGVNGVERQRIEVAGAGALEIARVQNSAPAGTEYALVTRPIPSGTQTVTGSVSVSNLPSTQAVSGTVAVSNLPSTQTVSGTVAVSNLPATQPVSAASLPLPSGAATSAKQPALGVAGAPSTDVLTVQGAASMTALKVDGSAVTQPISGSVSVSNFPATQPVSGTVAVSSATLATAAAASSSPVGSVSLGNSLGKADVMKTGSLATSATTADQVVLTYTVTSGKTFYLEYLEFNARLTTFAATATLFGAISLETPSGTKVITTDLFHSGTYPSCIYTFAEPIPIASATVIRVVCTPAASTAMTWKSNFGGYEK